MTTSDPPAVPLAAQRPHRPARATTCRCPTARRPPAPRRRASRRRHAATSASRPKNPSASTDVVGHQAQVRARRRWARAGPSSATSDGSWRRIAASSATSSGPGSRPSSVASTVRAWCRVRSASPWRPAWYWARASSAHRRSRNGASPTSAWASASTSRCRPARSAASTQQLLGVAAAARRAGAASIRAGVPAVELEQRRAPPQRQRLAQHVGGPLGLAQRQQLAAALDQALEPLGVDLVDRDREPVSLRRRLDRRRRRAPCAAGRRTPARPWSTTRAAARPTARRPGCSALTASPGRSASAASTTRSRGPSACVILDPDRAQDRDTHHGQCSPATDTRQQHDTALIPQRNASGTVRCDDSSANPATNVTKESS